MGVFQPSIFRYYVSFREGQSIEMKYTNGTSKMEFWKEIPFAKCEIFGLKFAKKAKVNVASHQFWGVLMTPLEVYNFDKTTPEITP